MASDSSPKDPFLAKVRSRLSNSLPFRQSGSTTSQGQGDGSLSSKYFKSLSRSSTINLLPGNAEHKNDHAAGHTPSTGDPSAPTQPRTTNIVLFGETGVGKSSVINLIARREVAKVSSDVNGCTMQSTRHDISFDGMDFAIFDTIGLEEPQMGVNGYLKAIEKAYELITRLSAAGGIHLLLFCMRGGRITATTQSNYRLFCECLCSTKVPIALVFTGLEREVEMEDWWKRNQDHVERYGIKSNGHACITAVQDDTPGEDLKYTESQKRIRELLKTCALQGGAFLLETNSWFAKLGKGLKSFIEKHKSPKRRSVMWVLTHRCKLDQETAKKIAEMMEKGDGETKDHEDPTAGNEPENKPNSAAGIEVNEADVEPGGTVTLDRDTLRRVAGDGALGNSQGHVKAGPRPPVPEKDKNGSTHENITEDRPSRTPTSQHSVEAPRRTGRLEGVDKGRVVYEQSAGGRPSGNLQNVVETRFPHVGLEGREESGTVNEDDYSASPQDVVEVEPCPAAPGRKHESGTTKQRVPTGHLLSNPQSDVQVGPRAVRSEERSEGTDDRDTHPPVDRRSDIDADSRAVWSERRNMSGGTQNDVKVERSEPRTVKLDRKTNENIANSPVPAVPPRHPARASAEGNRSTPPIEQKGGFVVAVQLPAKQQKLTTAVRPSGSSSSQISFPT